MAKGILPDTRSLPARLILSFVAVIMVTTLVVGLPALRLIDEELERQADARLEQGARATEALYELRLREMVALATLSAERPTLQRLLIERDSSSLAPYLETIRSAAQLDVLIVLDNAGTIVAQAPPGIDYEWSQAEHVPAGADSLSARLDHTPINGAETPIILSFAPIIDEGGQALGQVVELSILDDAFLSDLAEETGLQHTLYLDAERAATSLPKLPTRFEQLDAEALRRSEEPFYIQPIPLGAPSSNLVNVLALPGADYAATRQRVLSVLVGSTMLVTALAALLGYRLARRVTAPLQHLVTASEVIGQGDLSTPVPPWDGLTEVSALARALEQMRRRLFVAREELQRSKAWSENLIASLTEGVVTLDSQGRLTSFSPGAERILGWQARDVIGRPYESVFLSSPDSGSVELPAAYPAPGTSIRQTIFTRVGAPVALVISAGAAIQQPDHAEQALVFRNVTDEERALRLREFLLASVTHEFRTPLSSLHAAVELLASNLSTLTKEELQELVDSVWQGTLRLEELVDNLLSSVSLHTGHFVVRPRPSDLDSIIEEVLLSTQPMLAPRGQFLKIDAPSPLRDVMADPRRLNQVLVNLISNASKYGPPRSAITVRVREREQDVVIEVSDYGKGVPSEMQPFLFQPFSRDGNSEHSGVGLGLSIVKAIVERHGGMVGLRNGPGTGATFWFTLPVVPSMTAPLASEESNP